MEETKEFRTSDLFLASFLKASGFEIDDVIKTEGKTVFCFIDKEDRKQLVKDYFNNKATIECLSFVRAQRELKGMLYNL